MLTEKEQDAYNRGLVNGANIVRDDIIGMLTKQLDLEHGDDVQCLGCQVTQQYIDILKDTHFKVQPIGDINE
jgi:hypothetical protein